MNRSSNQVYPATNQRTRKKKKLKSERTADPEEKSPVRANAGAAVVRKSFADVVASEIDGCDWILATNMLFQPRNTKKDKELISKNM